MNLNLQIMSAKDILRWFKPTTETEQILFDKLKETLENKNIEADAAEHREQKLEDKIEDLTFKVGELETEVRELETQVKELETERAELETERAELETLQSLM